MERYETYKDSGIEWIGEIPEGWNLSRNKNVFSCRKSIVGDAWSETQLLSLTTKGIRLKDIDNPEGKLPESFDGYQIVRENDIVMCLFDMDCSAVFSGRSSYAGMISPAYRVLSCKAIVPSFADYWFTYIGFDRKFLQYSKTIRYTLTYDEFASLPIVDVPISEQRAIADFLDEKTAEIDGIVSETERSVELLREYHKSVISEAVTKGLDPDAPMKDSGVEWIGEIPEGWKVLPSKYVFKESHELKHKGDDRLAATQKYGVISQARFMEMENQRVVQADKNLDTWKHVEPNDFVISLRSFQSGLEICNEPGCVTWHYIVLKNQNDVVYGYYKYLFKCSQYITALQRTCTFIRDGQDLRYSNFVQVPLPVPPLEDQAVIADYLDAKTAEIDALIADKEKQVELLKEYRKSLISEAVTGKFKVPGVK